MRPRWFKRTADCRHSSTISVIQSGLERVVCEECGDVTTRYESMISGDLTRERFARRNEELFLKNLLALTDD